MHEQKEKPKNNGMKIIDSQGVIIPDYALKAVFQILG